VGDYLVDAEPAEPATAQPAVPSRSLITVGRLAVAALALFATIIGWATVAQAESPSALVDELNLDGVYVSRVRTDVDEEALEAAVKEVGFTGLRLVAVAPIDPQPYGEAFARRIQEAVDADAALVFMADGTLETYVIDELAAARIRATEKAEAVEDPARAVLVFADELTSPRSQERPEIIGQLIMAVLLMALGVGLIVGIEQSVTASRRHRQASKVTT
jgi:hypothetical protein